MSRYRAPRPPSSKFITPEGAAALKAELDYLWKTKRPAVTRAVAEAAAQGDRSENAEYIYGKKQLAEIDRRVRFLRKRLDGIRIVTELPSDTNKVYFGAWFDLIHADGHVSEHRLVGPDEIDFDKRYVSIDSPLGRSIIGKPVDRAFELDTPKGQIDFRITNVRYGDYGKKKPDRGSGESQGEIVMQATANETS